MAENVNMEQEILKIMELRKLSTGAELIEIISKELNIEREDAIEYVLTLEDEKLIIFIEQNIRKPTNIQSYLVSSHAYWYCLVTIGSLFTLFSSIIPSPQPIIILYLTYLVGSFFVLFLPGYCITRIFYLDGDISRLKRVLFSMGFSISASSIIGVIMNYTPWGINKIPIVISEFILITVLSSYGVYREFNNISM